MGAARKLATHLLGFVRCMVEVPDAQNLDVGRQQRTRFRKNVEATGEDIYAPLQDAHRALEHAAAHVNVTEEEFDVKLTGAILQPLKVEFHAAECMAVAVVVLKQGVRLQPLDRQIGVSFMVAALDAQCRVVPSPQSKVQIYAVAMVVQPFVKWKVVPNLHEEQDRVVLNTVGATSVRLKVVPMMPEMALGSANFMAVEGDAVLMDVEMPRLMY